MPNQSAGDGQTDRNMVRKALGYEHSYVKKSSSIDPYMKCGGFGGIGVRRRDVFEGFFGGDYDSCDGDEELGSG